MAESYWEKPCLAQKVEASWETLMEKSNHTDIDLSGLFLQGALQQIKSFSSKNLNQNERKVKSEETSKKTWYAVD